MSTFGNAKDEHLREIPANGEDSAVSTPEDAHISDIEHLRGYEASDDPEDPDVQRAEAIIDRERARRPADARLGDWTGDA